MVLPHTLHTRRHASADDQPFPIFSYFPLTCDYDDAFPCLPPVLCVIFVI